MKKKVVLYKKTDVDVFGDGSEIVPVYTEYTYLLISEKDISECEYQKKSQSSNGKIILKKEKI